MISDAVLRRLFYISLIGLLICFGLIVSGCASSGLTRSLQAAVVVTQALDVHSSHVALSSGQGREGNPLMPNTWWQQAAIKAPITWGLLWATTQAEARGHKTLARIVLGSIAGALAIVAARNYQVAR